MSSFEINGKGGAKVEVTPAGRMLGSAASLPYFTQVSIDKQEAYLVNTGMVTIPSPIDAPYQNPGTPMEGHLVQWFKNTHPTKAMAVQQVAFNHDGGPGHSYYATTKTTFGNPLTPPSANISPSLEAVPFRLNAANQSPPSLSAFAWDGVGSGMVTAAGSHDPSLVAQEFTLPPGLTELPKFQGANIFPPGAPAIYHVCSCPELLTGEVTRFLCVFLIFHIDLNQPYI